MFQEDLKKTLHQFAHKGMDETDHQSAIRKRQRNSRNKTIEENTRRMRTTRQLKLFEL